MLEFKKVLIKSSEKELVNISFGIKNSLALIGESGSGKSLTVKSILDLVPSNLESRVQSNLKLDKDIIGFVPQNPFTALSPMTKIKEQFFSPKDSIINMLKLVGLEKDIINRFPSELSGGQLQRVIIAMALIKRPKLLLLDEPTTALDSNTKESIIQLIKRVQNEFGFLTLFVTHEIFLIEELCEYVAIMKSGKIIEYGETKEILKNPSQLYTKKLIDASFKNRRFRE
jgi:peptide/nickel transport system ATP-binding protein